MYNWVNNFLLVHPYARHQALPLAHACKAHNAISSISRVLGKVWSTIIKRQNTCYARPLRGSHLGDDMWLVWGGQLLGEGLRFGS